GPGRAAKIASSSGRSQRKGGVIGASGQKKAGRDSGRRDDFKETVRTQTRGGRKSSRPAGRLRRSLVPGRFLLRGVRGGLVRCRGPGPAVRGGFAFPGAVGCRSRRRGRGRHFHLGHGGAGGRVGARVQAFHVAGQRLDLLVGQVGGDLGHDVEHAGVAAQGGTLAERLQAL